MGGETKSASPCFFFKHLSLEKKSYKTTIFWVVVLFQGFFGIFTPKIGEDEPNLTIIFFKGVEATN